MPPLDETTASLLRMQDFDPATLVQESKLGVKNFSKVVEPATRLVQLYKRLSERALEDLSDNRLNEVRNRANSDYNQFKQILEFDPDRTTADRDSLVLSVAQAYGPTFDVLHPLVAYSLHRSADFQRLDSEARATLQSVTDRASAITKELEDTKRQAGDILSEVRKTAAESGVTQQAIYFKEAAESHDTAAETWRQRVIYLAWGAGIFSFLSLFIHKIPFLTPTTTYEAFQIAISKFLIFGVLSFVLYLAARNFLSHQHNAIVNRHRHQALLTYQALVDAAADSANRDIVLSHAAACIFGPQPSGYSSDGGGGAPSAKSVVELMGAGIAKAGKVS